MTLTHPTGVMLTNTVCSPARPLEGTGFGWALLEGRGKGCWDRDTDLQVILAFRLNLVVLIVKIGPHKVWITISAVFLWMYVKNREIKLLNHLNLSEAFCFLFVLFSIWVFFPSFSPSSQTFATPTSARAGWVEAAKHISMKNTWGGLPLHLGKWAQILWKF